MVNKINFDFKNGLTLVNNVPCLILTLNLGVLLIKKLCENKEYIKHREDKIYEILNWMDIGNKKFNIIDFKLFLTKLVLYGYGNFNLIQFNSNKLIIKNENPTFHLSYLEFTGKEILCFTFVEQLILEYLKIKLNKNLVLDSHLKNKNLYLLINVKENCDYNYPIVKKINYYDYEIIYNSLLINVIKNNHLKLINGSLTIWNMRIITVPFHLFDYQICNNNILEMIFELGIEQGKTAVEFQIKKIGKKDNELILFSILDESQLVGMGVVEDKFFDKNKKKFKFKMINQFLETNYLKWYLLGIFCGAMEDLFNQKSKGKIEKDIYTITLINQKKVCEKKEDFLKLKKIVNVS